MRPMPNRSSGLSLTFARLVSLCLVGLMLVNQSATVFLPSGTAADVVTAACDPLTVTSTGDDSNCGTLRYAVNYANANANKTINLSLAAGTKIILNDSLALPSGSTLNGNCVSGAPGVTISGNGANSDGLVLSSGVTLNGVKVEGFAGRQISVPNGGNNQLKCVSVSSQSVSIIQPVDPVTVAPKTDTTVSTTLCKDSTFLYTGTNPVQTGVNSNTINCQQAAVLRGKVLDRQGQPVSRVTVKVLNKPEFGQTLSRADGLFDLAVNGGGLLTVSYEKAGFLPVQRQVNVPWQDYTWLPDVVLVALDPQVTAINLASNDAMQVVRGSPITDSDGKRQATLLVPQNTTATIRLPDGTKRSLTNVSIRATEFTVGANGPKAMPGALPPTSGYTYAAEWSVDEAIAQNATQVDFNQPVIQYLENFLNFPAGMIVPAGYYDREQGLWIPAPNGRVVKIISIANGLAEIDTDGNGTADNGLGITQAERQQLAKLYSVGQTLWRTPLDHFTPWDCNWPYSLGQDAVAPPKADVPKQPLMCPFKRSGSIIECENQIVGEELPLVGVPFSLNYNSERVAGRKATNNFTINLTGATVPATLRGVELEIQVAGQRVQQKFDAKPNQNYTFTWDGKDGYGRTLQGQQPITVRLGYTYQAVYQQPADFANSFASVSGLPLEANRARQEITVWQESKGVVGTFEAKGQLMGAWTLSAHHSYDPASRTLYFGDGTRKNAESLNTGIITTIAGGNNCCDIGDGGPALKAYLGGPVAIATGLDGSIYFPEVNGHRVRRVSSDGIITTVAGTGFAGFSGDNDQATKAQLNRPTGVAIGVDGTLFIADNGNERIRKVSPNGIITTIAGGGSDTTSEGILGTKALIAPSEVAVGPDNSAYFTDYSRNRIRRVTPDGTISTIAGIGTYGFGGDGGPATKAQLAGADGIAVGLDSSIYIADLSNHRIRKVSPSGIITTVAGGGNCCDLGDGAPATQVYLPDPRDISVGTDGTFYITDSSYPPRVRRVTLDGIITTVAGGGNGRDGSPATQASVGVFDGATPGIDGSLYIADYGNNSIRRVIPAMPGIAISDFLIPSDDGSEVYVFNSSGKHLKTVDAVTNVTIYTFGYDTAGRLISITDRDGDVTKIERNGDGVVTGILSPDNQRTTFAMNSNGYLASLTNPANETTKFSYTADGLLTSMTDARNNATTYSFDALGRLTSYQNAAGGTATLNRVEASGNYTVTFTTGLNRANSYGVVTTSSGVEQRTNTAPTGLQTKPIKGTDGTRGNSYPDGTTTNTTLGADPRWQMQAPLATSANVKTPAGLTYSSSTARTVTLANPADPLSLATMTETNTINGRNYTSSYTASTKTFTDTTPTGRQSTMQLDAKGRVALEQVTGLNASAYTYDARGRLATITQGTGAETRTTTFTYNAQGYLATITDPTGRVVSFNYDAAGRVTSQTLPGSRTIAYAYDTNGNLTSLTPPDKTAHTFTYTPVNLTASYTAPAVTGGGTNKTSYDYNTDKQPTRITRPDNQLIEFAYDTAGRLKTLTTPLGALSYTYDPASGNLTSISSPGGVTLNYSYDGSLLTGETLAGPVAGSVTHSYDNNFRVTTESVNNGNTVFYSYDNDSLMTQAGNLTMSRNAQNGLLTGTSVGSISTGYSYNGFAELTSQTAASNGANFYSISYTRDKLGRITQKVEVISGVTTTYDYSYDAAGRLATVKQNGTTTATYSYDANGNRLSKNSTTATYDAQDRLLTYGTNNYSYTANGELSGKVSGGQTTSYQYDVLGNLVAVTLPNATQISYVVDGQQRRIGKKVNGTLQQGFLYDGKLRIVAELDGNNSIVSRFVYGNGVNVPEYMVKAGVTYRLITDQLGSVRLVVNTANGTIAQRIDYDEFGNVTADSSPGFQPFGFAGGLYDKDTKLVRFGARDYDAEIGRWTAKDPIGFKGGDTNIYNYAGSDPVNYIDQSGSCFFAALVEAVYILGRVARFGWQLLKFIDKYHLNDLYEIYSDANDRKKKIEELKEQREQNLFNYFVDVYLCYYRPTYKMARSAYESYGYSATDADRYADKYASYYANYYAKYYTDYYASQYKIPDLYPEPISPGRINLPKI